MESINNQIKALFLLYECTADLFHYGLPSSTHIKHNQNRSANRTKLWLHNTCFPRCLFGVTGKSVCIPEWRQVDVLSIHFHPIISVFHIQLNVAFGSASPNMCAETRTHTASMWSKVNMTFLKGSVLAQRSVAGPALKGPVRDFITAMCLKGSMARSRRQPCHNGSTHSSPTPVSWQQNTSSLLPIRSM